MALHAHVTHSCTAPLEMRNIDSHILLFPKQLPKTSSFSNSLFNCRMHDLSIQKLDKNSSSVMHVPSWSIISQLLFHVRYGQWNTNYDDFKTANLTTT